MKENTYRRSNIILFTVLAVIVIAAFSVGIYLFLSSDEPKPVISNGTDSYETTEGITAEPFTETVPITDEIKTTMPPETEPPIEPTFEEQAQAKLDKTLAEIIAWIGEAVPTYKTVEETDTEGNITVPSEEYKPPVAFYYQDIKSGCIMAYNADHIFYTASIIKEPYVLWALGEIEKAEAEGTAEGTKYDVDSIFVYTEDKYKSGSGIIQKAEFGTAYAYYDLLRLAITESDNVAFAELRNIYGRSGFNAFSESIGVNNSIKSLYSASAREMGAYLAETYRFFESGSKYAEMLKSWMLDTNHRIMIPSAVSPSKAANKYGWDLEAYHDMAIVFDENPYLLVIMTELDNGSQADNRFIRDLVGKINTAHREIIGGAE
ncbi:MAG: serine hydrolase [Clostridia bacterium]|nr:serine hydrolase [Clostridia bacterium]